MAIRVSKLKKGSKGTVIIVKSERKCKNWRKQSKLISGKITVWWSRLNRNQR